MDIAAGLSWLWDAALIKIVPFFFILTIIIFVHEMGHFIVGRLCGIRVLAFSIGFGPELVGFSDAHGTRWKLSAIPLGGYVKFLGDETAASTPDRAGLAAMTDAERARAFPAKSVPRRALTVAAGPFANFILSAAIFAAVGYWSGQIIGDPVVSSVVEGSPAAGAGFKAGDRVLSLDGTPITTFEEIPRYVASRADVPIAVAVERRGGRLLLNVTPRMTAQDDGFGGKVEGPALGLRADDASASFRRQDFTLFQAIGHGASETWFFTSHTVSAIAGILTGRQAADQIGGPIRIAQISSQFATVGFTALMLLAAQLSISIGLLNLLPIPMLDGGHLLFYAVEGARGRPLSDGAQEIGFRIGIALVLMLMVFAFWNDLSRLV